MLSIRSIRSICQMEKFTIDSTSAVVDRTIASQYCQIESIRQNNNCISLERSGQSAVDSIDSFDLSNGKVHYRFDKCGRRSDNCISLVTTTTRCKIVESIDSFDLSNGKVHYRFDKCGRRSDNCISLVTTATRCKIVESIDSFDWWK